MPIYQILVDDIFSKKKHVRPIVVLTKQKTIHVL